MGKPRAAAQGGILEGGDPSKYDPKNPIIIFIIQAGIIIIFCRLLHFPLSKIRQPRVIAEVLGGILLGPSVMGRIPGFTATIFPAPSMPTLTLAANVGLVLFLFLVGLEVDLRLMLHNWKIALGVGAAGMALPFGFGCAIAYGLYHQFREDAGLVPISFGTYMLFIGVAMAITAFPVLCRILTELKLLQTQVGVVVLSAGVSNDVIGWILLALCVALVNAGSGITALYVLLTCVGWVLFLVYAVRPPFLMLLRRSGSLHNGPSQSIVGLTLLMVFTSAFFTGIIGVHPIFGAFLVGLICPHEGGFAIKLTEKIEDLVAVFFLPLYFALSGLSTNLGLLDSGITWAYVIGVIAVAFIAKVAGGTLAARANKMIWRESFTIGVLMSCKGLVELIVLNIGLSAKILSQRTFTIFVVMALVTTFATTPLTLALFPPWYQKKLAAWKRGEIDWDGNHLDHDHSASEDTSFALEKDQGGEIHRLLVCLRLESLPSLFTFVALLGGDKTAAAAKLHPTRKGKASTNETDTGETMSKRPLEVHGLRMLELTERLSSAMRDAEVEEWSSKDPVVNAFHTFGQLSNVAVSGAVELVPEGAYPAVLSERAEQQRSDMILLPWSENGNLSETFIANVSDMAPDAFSNIHYNHFVTKFLDSAPCNAAVFVNNGFGALPLDEPRPFNRVPTNPSKSTFTLATAPLLNRDHHLFFPFIGGPDDRVALRFVLRLAKNPNVTATIIHLKASGPSSGVAEEVQDPNVGKGNAVITNSEVQTTSSDQDRTFFTAMADSLATELQDRVVFDSMDSTQPTQDSLATARAEVGLSTRNAGDLIIVGRSHGRQINSSSGHTVEEGGIGQSLGVLAETMILGNVKASVLVIHAGRKDL